MLTVLLQSTSWWEEICWLLPHLSSAVSGCFLPIKCLVQSYLILVITGLQMAVV